MSIASLDGLSFVRNPRQHGVGSDFLEPNAGFDASYIVSE